MVEAGTTSTGACPASRSSRKDVCFWYRGDIASAPIASSIAFKALENPGSTLQGKISDYMGGNSSAVELPS